MVMTQKSIKDKLKKGFPVKDDDPRYKSYTKAQAVAANAKLKEDARKVEAFKESLKNESTGDDDVEEAKLKAEAEERKAEQVKAGDKIKKLEAKLEKESGPGSNARKKKIQDEIDELMKQV